MKKSYLPAFQYCLHFYLAFIFNVMVETNTYSHSQLKALRVTKIPNLHCFSCGRKLEYPGGTHTDTKRTCKLQEDPRNLLAVR